MTKCNTAIKVLAPRIELGQRVTTEELARFISRETALNRGEIQAVLMELSDAVLFFGGLGRPDGSCTFNVRVDRELIRCITQSDELIAQTLNREHVGLSGDDLVQRWNQLHPEDPVDPIRPVPS
ncbi:MAG: hypothetical protein JXA97_01015 [Anaerolineales bacterium]|nr:hypothetical protein [Anaerolineales bacterium]